MKTDKGKQAAILGEVSDERDYQDKLWNNDQRNDDTSETDESFVKYIQEYATGSSERASKHDFRKRMVKVAALAVAAIERADRVNGS